jgi:hypothetical protein
MNRKTHWPLIIGLALVLLVAWKYLAPSGATGGHATPADALASGWAVFQRGIDGWQEHGPNGEIIDHDSGWNADITATLGTTATTNTESAGIIGSGDAPYL